jgi:2-polyprenyl-3-methyl-5-hydroxy-6-metoxy-1,4-benzoquinol methylase
VGEADGGRVCDLACGQGILARELAERGAAAEGVDVSEKMLRIARRFREIPPLLAARCSKGRWSLKS